MYVADLLTHLIDMRQRLGLQQIYLSLISLQLLTLLRQVYIYQESHTTKIRPNKN